jgi:hypothetical protein
MQKWEYCTLEWDHSNCYEIRFPDLSKKANRYTDTIFIELLNHLGNDGWELVTDRSGPSFGPLIFKRPKTN